MAALIFGVAVAPVISGTAIAQSENPQYTEKQKKEQRSDESKQQKAQQNTQAAERKQASEAKQKEHLERKAQGSDGTRKDNPNETSEENSNGTTEENLDGTIKDNPSEAKQNITAAKELQQQRIDALKEKQRISQEIRDEQERIDRAAMQQRIDQLNDRSPMTEALDRLNNSKCIDGTIFDSASKSCVDTYSDNVPRTIDPPNGTLDGTLNESGTYFEKLRYTILEQQRLQDNLYRQITMLLNLVDSMCEDRVLVSSVSDGTLRCMDSDRAFNMFSRGLVTLVE